MISRSQYQIAAAFLAALACAAAQAVPRARCFPVEDLPEALRPEAARVLLQALDSEALYTVAGGLKPMSGGFVNVQAGVDGSGLDRAHALREIFAACQCGGEIRFELHHFARVQAGAPAVRTLEGVVFNVPAFASLLRRRRDVFAPWGFTPNANPMEVLMTVEYLETGDRYRGYGLMFGYPDVAVEFFVKNTPIPQTRNRTSPHAPAARGKERARIAPRRFISIPTVAGATGRFVYAVPADHQESPEDAELRKRAEPILAEYRRRREKYIGEGKPGVVELLRDWFCSGEASCAPSHASFGGKAALVF